MNEQTEDRIQYRVHTHTIRSLIYGLQTVWLGYFYMQFIPFINQTEVVGCWGWGMR